MRQSRLRAVIGGILLLGSSPVAPGADSLVLANGDRIQGSVLVEEAGIVLFESEVLGLLEFPAEEVTVVRKARPVPAAPGSPPAPDAPPEAPADAPPEAPADAPPEAPADAPPEAPADGSAERAPTGETPARPSPRRGGDGGAGGVHEASVPESPPADAEATSPSRPDRPRLPEPWTGELGLSYLEQGGRTDLRQAGVEAKVSRSGEKTHLEWGARYRQDDVEGDGQSARSSLDIRQSARFPLGPRIAAEAHTRYEDDNYLRERREFSQTANLGIDAIDNEKLSLRIAPGLKAQHIERSPDGKRDGTHYKVHAREDLSWQIRKDLRLGQEMEASVDPRNPDDWDVGVRAYLETRFPDSINVRLHYRYDFENQLEEDKRESSEVGASVVLPF